MVVWQLAMRTQDRHAVHNLGLALALRLIAAWRGQANDFSR
jgi:hypothetical protein